MMSWVIVIEVDMEINEFLKISVDRVGDKWRINKQVCDKYDHVQKCRVAM